MCLKDADRTVNGVYPESDLGLHCLPRPVCPGLSVCLKLRIIMVGSELSRQYPRPEYEHRQGGLNIFSLRFWKGF